MSPARYHATPGWNQAQPILLLECVAPDLAVWSDAAGPQIHQLLPQSRDAR